jgi:aspartate dehydrogenase
VKAAIIGCGNIGTALASVLERQDKIKLCSIVDENIYTALRLRKKLKIYRPEIVSLEDAIENNDLIIEAASPSAVRAILQFILKNRLKKKLMVISTGGLISKNNLLKKIQGCELYIPSGAIAGLDAIKAVSSKIESLELITTKPPVSLLESPFVKSRKLNLRSLKKKKVIFEGNIFEAVNNFPQNINVAASLFLASGFKKIKVSIIADPKAATNTHEVICKGKFGVIHTTTNNFPSPNPKTSYLALLSAQSVLLNIDNPVKIGG